ncbi:Uncharacterised protein r2_g3862 [Pycnogonum litorale]
MKANPDKVQIFAVGQRSYERMPNLQCDGATIQCSPDIKLLGVTIDHKLIFSKHISELCRKSSKQINVLKRIHTDLNYESRIAIYHAFILSNFDFCPLIWHFCNSDDNQKLEDIKNRTLRVILNDYSSSYHELLSKCNFPHIEIKTHSSNCARSFKHFNRPFSWVFNQLVQNKSYKYSLRYSKLAVPCVRMTKYGIKSFKYTAATVWNTLLESIRSATDTVTIAQFANLLSKRNDDECECSGC